MKHISGASLQTRRERLAGDKHFRLLRKSVNYGQKSFITLAPGNPGSILFRTWSCCQSLQKPFSFMADDIKDNLECLPLENTFILARYYYCVKPFQVKQRCSSDDFIAINDALKRLPCILCVTEKEGKRAN